MSEMSEQIGQQPRKRVERASPTEMGEVPGTPEYLDRMAALPDEMGITEAGRNRWSVLSDSGNTYNVRFRTHLDAGGSMYFRWECDCPSRKYPCKHALAVEADTDAVDEQASERVA